MKTRNQVLKILKQEFPHIRKNYNVKSLGLFGSYSRKEQSSESDIDILVELDKPIGFFKFIELEEYLSEKLGEKVELVSSDAVKPVISSNIMENIVYVQ